MEMSLKEALIRVDERFERTVRYTREEISRFAFATLDHNPLHHDTAAARGSRFGDLIASGQQTAATMMGLLATHFSRDSDGIKREMLCLNFNFAFKSPVFADHDVRFAWHVRTVEWNQTLGGMLGHVDGSATMEAERACVVARGTILVKLAGAE